VRTTYRTFASLALTAAASLAFAGQAAAQGQGDGFLFKQPTITLGVKGGYAVAGTGSEVFDLTFNELTVDKSDFNAFTLSGELAVRATERLDIAIGVGWERSEANSEYIDFVDQDEFPIQQTTNFTRVPATAGLKFYLTDRGRRISRLAWIPNKIAPYVAGGGGLIWYEFQQVGDFVDFDTFEVFFDDFVSSGTAAMGYLGGGVDVSIGPRWLITAEGRYRFANAEMDEGFIGFDPIDLNGLTASAGVSFRF
jgi:hypothetical protein